MQHNASSSETRPAGPHLAGASRFAPGGSFVRSAAWCWVALAALAYAWQLYRETRVGLTDGARLPLGVDYLNYWGSAVLAWQDRADEIYDWQRYYSFLESVVGAPIGPFHFSYPPVLLLLTLPLAAFPYVPGLAFWLLSGWYAFYRALRLAMPQGTLLLALATPAVFVNAMGGQNGFWTAALMGGGLCLLQPAPIAAGVLFGLLAYKPHLALLIPLALAAGRQWRAFFAAAATVLVLIAASILAFGADIWTAYFDRVAALRIWILEDGEGIWHRMVSIFVAARRLGVEPHLAYLIQGSVAFAAGAVVVFAWWRDAPAPIRYSLLVLGNFLATPYLQDYDLVVGAFVAAWLVGSAADRQQMREATVAAFLVLLLPIVAGSFGKMTGFSPGPLFLIPAFVIAARRIPGWSAPVGR